MSRQACPLCRYGGRQKVWTFETEVVPMCISAALATSMGGDDELLREINDALLAVQVYTKGKANEVGYTPKEVTASRRTLIEFLEILSRAISREESDPFYFPSTPKEQAAQEIVWPQQLHVSWIEEIRNTIQHLESPEQPWETSAWNILEQVVDFLQAQARPRGPYTQATRPWR